MTMSIRGFEVCRAHEMRQKKYFSGRGATLALRFSVDKAVPE